MLVGIDKAGRWHRESERTLAAAAGDPRGVALDASAPAVGIEEALVPRALGAAGAVDGDDVVFPVLHGTFGEDGTVQGAARAGGRRLRRRGRARLGHRHGQGRREAPAARRRHSGRRLRGRQRGARSARDPAAALARACPTSASRCYVKPANAGSSVGVSRVAGPGDLERAVRAALAFDGKVLVERGVDAREIECAVLGNDDPQASVPGEIVVHHKDGFYSYDAKYVDRRRRELEDPGRPPAAS